MLSGFSCVLAVVIMGVRALARVVIECVCPRLENLKLYCRDRTGHYDEEDMRNELQEMVYAAGCVHRVRIHLENIRFTGERSGTWEANYGDEEDGWADEDDCLEAGRQATMTTMTRTTECGSLCAAQYSGGEWNRVSRSNNILIEKIKEIASSM